MKEDKWHQKIDLYLKPSSLISFQKTAEGLFEAGFILEEDIFLFPRTDKVEIWQTDVLITVEPYLNDQEIYFFADETQLLSQINFGYLLPWQPIANVNIYVSKVWELSKVFDVPVMYKGAETSQKEITRIIDNYAKDLEARIEPPGGEFLAQAIELKLPL